MIRSVQIVQPAHLLAHCQIQGARDVFQESWLVGRAGSGDSFAGGDRAGSGSAKADVAERLVRPDARAVSRHR
ncbi:hypothetical protein G6F65_018096 [Rhizopus arrhizus]|nr:hypothetical protein G6F65_018096 [Rhizopus arrhizus]